MDGEVKSNFAIKSLMNSDVYDYELLRLNEL